MKIACDNAVAPPSIGHTEGLRSGVRRDDAAYSAIDGRRLTTFANIQTINATKET